MERLTFRRAVPSELSRIMDIYAEARAFMHAHGNPLQWPEGYPPRAVIEAELSAGVLFLAIDGEEIAAVFSFTVGREPVYDRIDGAWQGDGPYGFMHRLAVVKRGGGVGAACLRFCFDGCHDLRVDTHRDNLPMQKLLQKCGFSYCGIVDYGGGETRLAYEKTVSQKATGFQP